MFYVSETVYLRRVETRNIDGHREYNGGGLLSGDACQCLQIAQLQGVRGLLDDLGSLLEGTRGLLLPLSGDDLHHCHHYHDLNHRHYDHPGPGLPRGLRLGGHGPLQLDREPHILDLHPLHLDAPGVRGEVEGALHHLGDLLPLGENLRQVLCAQDIPQGRGCQQLCGVTG